MGLRRLLTTTLALALVATGCLGATTDDLQAAEAEPTDAAPARTAEPLPPPPPPAEENQTSQGAPAGPVPPAVERFAVKTHRGGSFTVAVPVPVVLIGFPQDTADALAAALDPREVAHGAYNSGNVLMPGTGRSGTPLPITTVADYRVYRADDATVAEFVAFADGEAKVGANVHDANKIEDWLAARIAPDASAPALVLLAMPSERTYRYTYPGGPLEGVRVFGERHPLLVVDVTASTDTWVGAPRAYDKPLDVSEVSSVKPLAELVAHATHHRLLQGPLYPPATAPCHAVTVLVLERATSLGTPGVLSSASEMFDADEILASFEDLMGNPVHLDVTTLLLPVEDPALGALTTGGTSDALRTYLELNFDQYHVAHEGCEPYLSLLVDGDATDRSHGIAQFDPTRGHRISFSFVDDLMQLCFEQDVPVSCFDRTPDSFDWFNFLVAHETGHLLGQRHPHDITGGDVERTRTFSSVWSPMSYQVGDSIWEFGAIDRNNQLRNRVAYLYAETHADLGAAEADVIDALSLHHWAAAEEVLRAVAASS